jgi:excisionase family DNA binding protein
MELMNFMTVIEFAKVIKMTSHMVRKLIRDGQIYAVRPGKRTYRIPETEVERLTLKSMYKEEK